MACGGLTWHGAVRGAWWLDVVWCMVVHGVQPLDVVWHGAWMWWPDVARQVVFGGLMCRITSWCGVRHAVAGRGHGDVRKKRKKGGGEGGRLTRAGAGTPLSQGGE